MQRWIPAALMAATLGGATTAHALQMKLTRTELCSVADTVAVVDIVDLETRWAAADNGGIERIAFADVTHAVRGTDNSVQITLPGGTIGEVRHWVEDVPSLLVGGTYLLFLQRGDDGALHVVGGDQGAVRIQSQPGFRGEALGDALKSVEVCRG